MSSNHPAHRSGHVEKREFCRACGHFATGVAVAAVVDGDGAAHGITVNSFTSVSLEPPLVLICIAHTASILKHFRANPQIAINVLAEDQQALSERFARKGQGRFEGLEWRAAATGAPLIAGVLAAVECRIARTETAGDHDILIAEVERTHLHRGRPLVYWSSGYRRLEP